MSRLAAGAFAALVIATLGAFFGAQRLKNSPPVLGQIGVFPYFSPNGDGRFDKVRLTFRPKEADDITVAVLNRDGDEVRELLGSRHVHKGQLVRLLWDGRTDDGARAPDGLYRYRITLRHRGRSVKLARSVRLDTVPPRPDVRAIGPRHQGGPLVMPRPDGGEAVVHLVVPGQRPVIRLFKTSPGPTRLVLEDDKPVLGGGGKVWRWDGKTQSGRPVSPGTYLVSIETRDQAGNRGVSPGLNAKGLPVEPYGAILPGHGGITVRPLGVSPPAVATPTGDDVEFFVDARQKPWMWSLRRVGTNEASPPRRKTSPRVRIHAPGRESGVYLMQVRTRTRATTVPFAVQSRERHAVLVVMPVLTWQGRNPLDDDGDGLPNLLDRGVSARLNRIYVGDGLPADFATRDAPLLAWLDRHHHRYDITTDAALAAGQGPRLEGHKGVILPSDVRWLPRTLQQRLRRYVRDGGALASFGVDALRRQLTVAKGSLTDPTPAATTDLFGARLGRLQRLGKPTNLVEAKDDIQFFAGTAGAFGPFSSLQDVDPQGDGAALASAVTEDPQTGRAVIAVSRVGKGLVFRFPLPELPGLLASGDVQTGALLDRTWTLLSH